MHTYHLGAVAPFYMKEKVLGDIIMSAELKTICELMKYFGTTEQGEVKYINSTDLDQLSPDALAEINRRATLALCRQSAKIMEK